jgi:hypothetical protein
MRADIAVFAQIAAKLPHFFLSAKSQVGAKLAGFGAAPRPHNRSSGPQSG